MPNVIEALKRDHRNVEELFSTFESSEDPSVAEQICSELELHTAAEEQIVYPALRQAVTGGDKLADEAEQEHAQAKQIIGRIKRTTDPEHLSEVVGELKQAIEHHVEEEEGTVFPKMESDVGATELDAMGSRVQEFEQSA
jgi:iron-sulfur cluster repair protein YtfE (RIC family)